MNKEKNDRDFSKNSLINISKKAGIKCISHNGIEKTRELLNEKIKYLAERLCHFHSLKNSKTINKKTITEFLESEGIYLVS